MTERFCKECELILIEEEEEICNECEKKKPKRMSAWYYREKRIRERLDKIAAENRRIK